MSKDRSKELSSELEQAAEWAEAHDQPITGTTHRGAAAAERGRSILQDAGVRPGRPGLNPGAEGGRTSQPLNVRIPDDLEMDLKLFLGRNPTATKSGVVRDALGDFLKKQGNPDPDPIAALSDAELLDALDRLAQRLRARELSTR
jgi:hypothetical protein